MSENWAGIQRYYLKCAVEKGGRSDADLWEDLCKRVVNRLISDNIAIFDIVGDSLQITLPIFIDSIEDARRGIKREQLTPKIAQGELIDKLPEIKEAK